MQILYMVAALGSLICFIIVLVKMFQNAGVLQGILGLVCSIWAFHLGLDERGQVRSQEHHAHLDDIDRVVHRSRHRRWRFHL